MAKLDRDIDAIIASHEMDDSRKSVYVEGQHDRLFLLWCLGESISNDALINEISDVKVPETEGGERGRLLEFARSTIEVESIRVFVDADYDRIFNNLSDLPENVLVTDGRDIESYFLIPKCIEKFLTLSLITDSYQINIFFQSLVDIGRELGFIRIFSEKNNLNFPFQQTNLHRCIDFKDGLFELDIRRYVQTLIQNSGLGLKSLDEVLANIKIINTEYEIWDSNQLIHGKDLICLLGEVCKSCGHEKETAGPALFASFEKEYCVNNPNLLDILTFLS